MEKKKKLLFIIGKLVGDSAEKVLIDILNNLDFNKYDVDLALVERGGILESQVPSEVKIIELWKKNSFHYFMAIKFSLHLHWNIFSHQRLNSGIFKNNYDAEFGFLEGLASKLISMRKSKSPKFSWIYVDLCNFHRSKTFFYNSTEE